MLVEMLVLWRIRPICSAMDMNLWLKMDSWMVSSSEPTFFWLPPLMLMVRSPRAVTVAPHCGSTRMVLSWSMMMAGPVTWWPGLSFSIRKILVDWKPPSK